MSFKINDYNNFLTSMYEKDKMGEQEKNLDFDFGLGINEEPQQLQPEGLNEGPPRQLNNYSNNINNVNPMLNPYPDFSTTIMNNNFNSNIEAYPASSYIEPSQARPPPPPPPPVVNANYLGNNYVSDNSTFENRREISNDNDDTSVEEVVEKPIKKKHNVIEQRYRNKINDKFIALQNLVPSLRVAAKKNSLPRPAGRGNSEDDEEARRYEVIDDNLEGLEPARKLNKGTILAKSIEYIKFLELKNTRMKMENKQLIETARMLGIDINSINLNNIC